MLSWPGRALPVPRRAPALLRAPARRRPPSRSATRREEEIAIGIVQHETRTGGGNQDAHWNIGSMTRDRQREHPSCGSRHRRRSHDGITAGREFEHPWTTRLHDARERSHVQSDRRRHIGRERVDAARCDERGLMPVIADQVDTNERKVGGIVGEHAAGDLAGLPGRSGVTCLWPPAPASSRGAARRVSAAWFRSP